MGRLITKSQWDAINAKAIKAKFFNHFNNHGHKHLADKIEECGEPDENYNTSHTVIKRCGSVYCVKCHAEYVAKETKAVRALFDRYKTEANQRRNIFHLTIVFDAFRLFTKKGQLFVPKPLATADFPTDYAKTALVDARHKLKHKLRHQFPDIGYAGAFEWEVYSDMTLNWRAHDKAAAIALLGPDATRDPQLTYAQAHIVLFHAHIVVDLNDTPEKDFRKWMRNEFPKRAGIPVKGTVHIGSLWKSRTIEESLQNLARYPYKTYLHYKRPTWANPHLPIEGEVVAELAAFRSSLK